MKIVFSLFFLAILLSYSCSSLENDNRVQAGNTENFYTESWESLARHNEAPDWFKDAKFGIYFHWGVYSVPAYRNEWYPRWMHFEGSKEFDHHIQTYGHPSEFGYHDFVPLFRAEHFNADSWADLFYTAGARFAGQVAEHHDGFAMWDSDVTPWNSMDKGPHKDILGEMKEALDKKGMRMITTFHHARNLQRYTHSAITELESDKDLKSKFPFSHYSYIEGMPPASKDKELRYLYGNLPESQWLEEVWYRKIKEVIDLYQPDILWLDSWLDRIPESYRLRLCTYYLNQAKKWDKEVVIAHKQDDLPLVCSIQDLEKSRKNYLDSITWMTDETVSKGSWSYTTDLQLKSSDDLLHELIDICSKNGVMLLNISPKPDGTIPVDQQEVLLGIGSWLNEYGEAIYGTRPWYAYGEGPTKEPAGNIRNAAKFMELKYSAKDIRYTSNDRAIYAIMLGWPGDGKKVLLTSFSQENLLERPLIESVKILGSMEEIHWEYSREGLQITTPSEAPNDIAVVVKISLSI